jgi:hypothetical protein
LINKAGLLENNGRLLEMKKVVPPTSFGWLFVVKRANLNVKSGGKKGKR